MNSPRPTLLRPLVVSLVLTTGLALTFSVVFDSGRGRSLLRSSIAWVEPLVQVVRLLAESGTDRDGDTYASIPSGGTDCYDSLQSAYSDFPSSSNTCDSTNAATTYVACNDGPNPESPDDGCPDGNVGKPGDPEIPIVDHTFVQDTASGTWHMYFQNNHAEYPREDIEHFTSPSLAGDVVYEDVALAHGDVGAWDEQVWAPQVFKNSSDNKYWMFYAGVTGTDGNGTQRIGAATADTLDGPWTRVANSDTCDSVSGAGCVYNCNAAWTTWDNGGASDAQCRDPHVMWDDTEERWVMIATVRLDTGVVGTPDSQAVTMAYSDDLLEWEHAGYIKATRRTFDGATPQAYGGIAENPTLAKFNDTYYVFFTDYNDESSAGGQLCTVDDGVADGDAAASCTMVQYATSSSLTADASGSTNWTYRGYHPLRGVNATEILNLYGDTWVASSAIVNGNVFDQIDNDFDVPFNYATLTWHRITWNDDVNKTYTLSKLSNPQCRVAANTIHPGGTEICSDTIDQNCSAGADEALYCALSCTDADGDGWGVSGLYVCAHTTAADPNDTDAAIYPGAVELCDSKDNDSDGQTDEGGVCVPPVVSCTEQWSCGAWSACSQGTQTRTCTDANSCGTVTSRPSLSQSCIVAAPERLVVLPNTNRGTRAVVTSATGARRALWQPFGARAATLSVAAGDVDGDDTVEVVAGSASRVKPLIRVWSESGKFETQFAPFSSWIQSGVEVAVADIDANNYRDIVAVTAPGVVTQVATFRYDPATRRFVRRSSFTPQAGWRHGFSSALGDLDGDRKSELVLVPKNTARPVARVYQFNTVTQRWVQSRTFKPFVFPTAATLSVTIGDTNGDGTGEIIMAPSSRRAPTVRVFTNRGGLIRQFNGDTATNRAGLIVSAVDRNGDGRDEIVTMQATGSSSLIRYFSQVGSSSTFRTAAQVRIRVPWGAGRFMREAH